MDELDENRRRSEAMVASQRFMFGHDPDVCSWERCAAIATRAVLYRRVGYPNETAQRKPYCNEHSGEAIKVFAPTWNVVAWVEPIGT